MDWETEHRVVISCRFAHRPTKTWTMMDTIKSIQNAMTQKEAEFITPCEFIVTGWGFGESSLIQDDMGDYIAEVQLEEMRLEKES
jgi:hypothetical protein